MGRFSPTASQTLLASMADNQEEAEVRVKTEERLVEDDRELKAMDEELPLSFFASSPTSSTSSLSSSCTPSPSTSSSPAFPLSARSAASSRPAGLHESFRVRDLQMSARCHPLVEPVITAIRAVRADDVDTVRRIVLGHWPVSDAKDSDEYLPIDPSRWVPPSIVETRKGNVDVTGLDLDQPTTFLHLAARHSSLRCISLLVSELDVDVNLLDSQRATALDDCAFHGAVDAARLLVSLGCDPHHRSNGGGTIVHTAANGGHADFIRYAAEELHVQYELIDKMGYTPLFWAVDERKPGKGQRECTATLLELGANINARDNAGHTALMWALSSANHEVVKLLVRGDADLQLTNKEGLNAFDSQLWDPKGQRVGPDGYQPVEWAHRKRGKRLKQEKQAGKKRKKKATGQKSRKRKAATAEPTASEETEQAADEQKDQTLPTESLPAPPAEADGNIREASADGAVVQGEDRSVSAQTNGHSGHNGGERKEDDGANEGDGVVLNGDHPAVAEGDPLPSDFVPPLPSPLPYFCPSVPRSRLDAAEARIPLCWRHETLVGRCKRYLFQEQLNRAVEEGDYGNVELVRRLLSDWHADHIRYRMFPLVYDESYPIGPMQVAVAFDNDDTAILDLLLQARIDPNKKTATGFLPIHAAANVGNPRCVQLLLEKGGCDPNHAEETDGYTALMMAADDSNGAEVVKVLMARKDLDLNRTDHHGNTALTWAVFKGNLAVVQLLLKKKRGIEVDAVNKWGNTAMHYAFYRAWKNVDGVAVVRTMLDAGIAAHEPLNIQQLSPFDLFSGRETERGQLLYELLAKRRLLSPPSSKLLPLLPRLLPPPPSAAPPPVPPPPARRKSHKKGTKFSLPAKSSSAAPAPEPVTDLFAFRPVLHSEEDISGGLEPIKIPLVNHLDTDTLNFVYVRECVGAGGSELIRSTEAGSHSPVPLAVPDDGALKGPPAVKKETPAAAACLCGEGGCVDPVTCPCLGYFPWDGQKEIHYLDRFLSHGAQGQQAVESSGMTGLDSWRKRRLTKSSRSLSMAARSSKEVVRQRQTRNSQMAEFFPLSFTDLPGRAERQRPPKPRNPVAVLSSPAALPESAADAAVASLSTEQQLEATHESLCAAERMEDVGTWEDADSCAQPLPPPPFPPTAPPPSSTTAHTAASDEARADASQMAVDGLAVVPVKEEEKEVAKQEDSPGLAEVTVDAAAIDPADSSTLSPSLPPLHPASPSSSSLSSPVIVEVGPKPRAVRLPLHELSYLSECGPQCGCPASCPNRCTSGGVRLRLQVYKTVEKGWACRTLQPIRQGTFVTEYAGELLGAEEADRRLADYDLQGVHYMFSLKGSASCIDPVRRGNLGRLLNHSCSPNLQKLQVYQHCSPLSPPPPPRMVFVAKRFIAKYEELCISYDYEEQEFPGGCLRCHCGSNKCRFNLV